MLAIRRLLNNKYFAAQQRPKEIICWANGMLVIRRFLNNKYFAAKINDLLIN